MRRKQAAGLREKVLKTIALRTGRPARINGEPLAKGPFGAIAGRLGLRAAVATPVVAGGRYWGVTVAATSREDFPAGTESRMAEFVELAGMAIANAPEQKKLVEFEAQLKQGLGVTWSQLRDDIFGDAVVFAYRPGSSGKEDQEQGLMLVHARDAQLLANIAKRFNDIQQQSGDLKELSESTW